MKSLKKSGRTKKGESVIHKGKIWIVDKILIPGRNENKRQNARKDYIRAFPTCGKQILFRSVKTIGEDWK